MGLECGNGIQGGSSEPIWQETSWKSHIWGSRSHTALNRHPPTQEEEIPITRAQANTMWPMTALQSSGQRETTTQVTELCWAFVWWLVWKFSSPSPRYRQAGAPSCWGSGMSTNGVPHSTCPSALLTISSKLGNLCPPGASQSPPTGKGQVRILAYI